MEEFAAWYERVHPRVIGAVFVCCGDDDVAAEAADEAFSRALDRWERVTAMESPDAWVSKVAVNSMRRRMRRRRLERHHHRNRGRDVLELPTPYPEVWRAVRGLPQRQRLAVVLRYVADLTEADVGAVMGIARGTVSALLVTARSQLSQALQDFNDVDDLEAPHA